MLTGSDQGNFNYVRAVISELGLQSHVHMLGFIPHEDVIGLYRYAFALSYMSFFGPKNLPPLEAMSLGCPVVLSDIAGARSLFGEAPILVDPRDPPSIAAGIKRFHDDPALRERSVALGRQVAHGNTRQEYVRRLHELFDEFEAIRRTWASGPWPPA